MTRINSGIKPIQLTDQHLLTEYREIGRIATLLKKNIESGNQIKVTAFFKLGPGHMLFFQDKGKYLMDRYISLQTEISNRGFSVSFTSHPSFEVYNEHPKYYNDWIETSEAKDLLLERLQQKITSSKQVPRYYKKDIEKSVYFNEILKGLM